MGNRLHKQKEYNLTIEGILFLIHFIFILLFDNHILYIFQNTVLRVRV